MPDVPANGGLAGKARRRGMSFGMPEPSSWTGQLEAWTTILANVIAIGTFLVGIRPLTRWGANVRRDLTEVRRGIENPGTRAADDVIRPFVHIRLVSQVAGQPNRWNVSWSEEARVISGVAQITVVNLRTRLNRNPNKYQNRTIVGELRFSRLEGEAQLPQLVEITRVDFITGDWLSWVAFWIRRPFMG